MRTPATLLFASLGLLALALSGCSTYNTTVPEGSQVPLTGPAAPVYKGAQIIHTDMKERIATIRYGQDLGEGYLIATDAAGTQTAVLKGLPRRAKGLATADILEGKPGINNRVSQASAAQSASLAKIYRDADAGN